MHAFDVLGDPVRRHLIELLAQGELSAGARLFLRSATWLTMAAVVEEGAPPLADEALDAVVQRALAKDAGARFATPAALRAALT